MLELLHIKISKHPFLLVGHLSQVVNRLLVNPGLDGVGETFLYTRGYSLQLTLLLAGCIKIMKSVQHYRMVES